MMKVCLALVVAMAAASVPDAPVISLDLSEAGRPDTEVKACSSVSLRDSDCGTAKAVVCPARASDSFNCALPKAKAWDHQSMVLHNENTTESHQEFSFHNENT